METVSSFSSLAVIVFAAVLTAVTVPATLGFGQSTTNENGWEKASGGKQEFDAASIKPSPPDAQPRTNLGLSIDNEALPRGLLSASNWPLTVYIKFAYKIKLTREQEAVMVAHLPKWVAEQGFDFNARVEGSPSKDQTRLMMQSLLADRFKLKIHLNRVRCLCWQWFW